QDTDRVLQGYQSPAGSSRNRVHFPGIYVQAPQGAGQIWPGLRELLPGGQRRGLQVHAADHPRMASAIEVRQGTGRSFDHVRSDPQGLASILWPLLWIGKSTIWKHVNAYLVRWLMRKYKRLARHKL